MSFFIAIHSVSSGWKPVSRVTYPTKCEVDLEFFRLLSYTGEFKAFDVDHEPGKSIFHKQGARA